MKHLRFFRRHWFWILLTGFAVHCVFFDEHSLLRLMDHHHKQALLRREIAAYQDSILIYERSIMEVSGGTDELERYAREKLMMKRSNEDVYLIE